MKPDISSRADVKGVISGFYKKLILDPLMLPFFEEIIAQNHLEQHLEIITDFWQDILLDSTSYSNNVLKKHLDFDKKVTFKKHHFDRWLEHLIATVDTAYEGQVSENMKNRAKSIAMVMQIKMNLYN